MQRCRRRRGATAAIDLGAYASWGESERIALNVRVVHAGHYASFDRERFLQLIDGYLRRRG